MEAMNITMAENAAAETTTTIAQPKHKWLAKGCKFAKKATLLATTAGVMMNTCATHAFAATGVVIQRLSSLLRVQYSSQLSASSAAVSVYGVL